MEAYSGLSHVDNMEGEKPVNLQGPIHALGNSLEYCVSKYQGNFTSANMARGGLSLPSSGTKHMGELEPSVESRDDNQRKNTCKKQDTR